MYEADKPYGQAPVLDTAAREAIRQAADERARYALRDRALLALSFYSGLRAKELAGLTIGLLLDRRGNLVDCFDLPPALCKGRPRHTTVYVTNAAARAEILRYLQARLAAGASYADRVFVSRGENPMTPDTLRHIYKDLCARANIRATSHSGRRSFATDLDMLGHSMRVLQILMRHAHISTTAIYVETNPRRLSEAVASLRS